MGDVLKFTGTTVLDTPAADVLGAAIEADLDMVFVLGVRRDGQPYYAGSTSRVGDAFILFEKFKRDVIA